MPRNMSFALTTEQFKDRSKTVTRRFGWRFLKPGDVLWGVKRNVSDYEAYVEDRGKRFKSRGIMSTVALLLAFHEMRGEG